MFHDRQRQGLEFSIDTIPFDNPVAEYLCGPALDRQQIYGRREWTMDRFSQIYPEARFDLPFDADPAEERVQ